MSKEIKMHKKTFTSANILSVEVGTNTPMGGDASHNGKTVFKLTDECGTAWKIKSGNYEKDEPKEITIELYGDCEAETFIDALEFSVSALKAQQFAKES